MMFSVRQQLQQQRRISLLFVFALIVLTPLSSVCSQGTNNDAVPVPPTSACDHFDDDLPEECICSERQHHRLVIECLKKFENDTSFLHNDTVGIRADLDICNPAGSQLDIDLIEMNHNISYTVAGVHAGEETNIPIPGWSILVPGLGHVGMDIVVLLAGNPDMLHIKLGLNACAAVHKHIICADAVPGLNMILPWYILQGQYEFGDWCKTTQAEGGLAEDEEESVRGEASAGTVSL